MITKEQFDVDLAAFLTTLNNLFTAIDNYLANKADLTTEDQEIQQALTIAQAELAKLNPPPPPQP